jgi:LysM domain
MERVRTAGSRLVNGQRRPSRVRRQRPSRVGRQRPGPVGWQWRPVRAVGAAAVLLLAERLLVGGVGSPRMLVETLGDLGEPWADPVTSMLALMGLIAEALVGYLLLVLALRLLGTLPGSVGGLARRVTVATTPAVVRRLADVLIGGTLLAQVTLAAPVASCVQRPSVAHQSVPAVSALRCSADSAAPVRARPIHRRSAAPLPPWLRGGPSKPAPGHRVDGGEHTVEAGEHVVVAGDTLWDIAAAHLTPAARSAKSIHRYWQQLYQANRSVVGADPDLIHPGTRLDVVPFRQGR